MNQQQQNHRLRMDNSLSHRVRGFMYQTFVQVVLEKKNTRKFTRKGVEAQQSLTALFLYI